MDDPITALAAALTALAMAMMALLELLINVLIFLSAHSFRLILFLVWPKHRVHVLKKWENKPTMLGLDLGFSAACMTLIVCFFAVVITEEDHEGPLPSEAYGAKLAEQDASDDTNKLFSVQTLKDVKSAIGEKLARDKTETVNSSENDSQDMVTNVAESASVETNESTENEIVEKKKFFSRETLSNMKSAIGEKVSSLRSNKKEDESEDTTNAPPASVQEATLESKN